jgi:MFS family permease
MVTVIFAAYVLCLLLALLTVGSLSDYIGRRPAILSALVMNVVAMLVFMTARSAGALIVARAVQGFATGFATTTLGATILDTDRERAPVLNSVTAFAGLSAGTLGAGSSLHSLRRPNSSSSSSCSVEGYLAFTFPAMLAGFLAPVVGLTTAADFYGVAVIFLALASLSATTFWTMKR